MSHESNQGRAVGDNQVQLRCLKVYELNHRRERCVKAVHADDEPCQVNVWLAFRIEPLGVGIGTSISAEVTVRRVE